MATRLVVTRPERDAQRWVAELGRQGLAAEALPLIEIAALDVAPAIAAAWQGIARFSALMFVSANAVECFFATPLADPLADVRFLAPGPGTAMALREAGVPEAAIDSPPADAAQFDSETLWQVIGARGWAGRAVLVVRGQSAAAGAEAAAPGRDWLARRWSEAGASVEFLSVYERRAPRWSDAQREFARQASGDGSVWLFSSSEAVAQLAPLGLDWSRARAIATHPRIAEAARALGCGVVVASRPKPSDIRAIWASIESAHHE